MVADESVVFYDGSIVFLSLLHCDVFRTAIASTRDPKTDRRVTS